MGTFLRCMERGLRFFGGRPLVDIFDNMKTVVLVAHATRRVFNQRFLAYARARGFARAWPASPGKANEKGRVERPIGFVRDRFWPGRRFTRPARPQPPGHDAGATTSPTTASTRSPARSRRWSSSTRSRRCSSRSADVYFETDDIDEHGRHQALPGTLRPQRLLGPAAARRPDAWSSAANDEAVAVYLGPKQVALHRRCWGVGEDIEQSAHRKEAARAQAPRRRRRAAAQPRRASAKPARRYFKILAAGCRSLQRETDSPRLARRALRRERHRQRHRRGHAHRPRRRRVRRVRAAPQERSRARASAAATSATRARRHLTSASPTSRSTTSPSPRRRRATRASRRRSTSR